VSDTTYFYRDLNAIVTFADAMETSRHIAVPDDWWIVIADVIGSTRAIESGDYKKVNTIGVACIAAVVNVDRSVEIPFIFGGDGATFAIPDLLVQGVSSALRAAQRLSSDSFGLELRVGLVRVRDLGRQDYWVNLAKVRLSENMTQATFSGRGWEEAERRVKDPDAAGVLQLDKNDEPAEGSFDGFECRWQGVPSFNGHKLSLLVAAMSENPRTNLATYQAVINKIQDIYGDVANYHPLRPSAMQLTFNPRLLSHEWRVRGAFAGSYQRICYFVTMLVENLAGVYFFARKLDTASVAWSHYRDDLVENSDFRKFDGVLRMVMDGSDAQSEALESYLRQLHEEGRLAYGMFKSREALVTCLVQSSNGNHIHFVDGSDGGYALAARGLKTQLKSFQAV